MATQREHIEAVPLVGASEARETPEAADAGDTGRPICRSRIVKVGLMALIGALCFAVVVETLAGTLGIPHRPVHGEKAETAAVTGLVLQGNRVMLEVGTSTQAFAETGSSVAVAFLVRGSWTPDTELFPSVKEGQVSMASSFAPEWPTAVRLRINGNDGWGYKFIRMSFGGITRSVLESANGEPYGDNQFWLDGNQALQSERVFPVPSVGRRGGGGNGNALRLFVFFLFLLALAAAVAYFFRDHIRKYLAIVMNRAPGQSPQIQPALGSQQSLLATPMAPVATMQG